MLDTRDALRRGVATDSCAFLEAEPPLLAQVFRWNALFRKRLLSAAMQILAAGGIFGVVFRTGTAPSAIEKRRFAMVSRREQQDASFRATVLLRLKLFQSHMFQDARMQAWGRGSGGGAEWKMGGGEQGCQRSAQDAPGKLGRLGKR